MGIPDFELPDAITRYAGLSRDCANEVSRPHAIPITHTEKHAREVA